MEAKKEKKDPLKNLKPFTSETARLAQLKGAEVKKRNNAKRKKISEMLDIFLSLPVTTKKELAKLKKLGLEDDNLNKQALLVNAIYEKALKGDVQAFNSIRDTVGEKAVEKVEVTKSVDETVSEIEAYLCNKKKKQD